MIVSSVVRAERANLRDGRVMPIARSCAALGAADCGSSVEIMRCPSSPNRRLTSHDMWVSLRAVGCLAGGSIVGGS